MSVTSGTFGPDPVRELREIKECNAAYRQALGRLKRLFLRHANTVATSLTYLEQKALLSRQEVESHGFRQTEQFSDDEDKELGIYDDIWLDPADFAYENGVNYYGPVSFCFRTTVLDRHVVPVRVTRSNPTGNRGSWTVNTPESLRYYPSSPDGAKEFEAEFEDNVYGHSFTFRMSRLPFDQLAFVQIDNPGCRPEIYQEACDVLRKAAEAAGVTFRERTEGMYKKDGKKDRFGIAQQYYRDLSDAEFAHFYSPQG